MKKINFLFSTIFFVFSSSDCFNIKDSFVYRHKKKIITSIIASVYILIAYQTNKEFHSLYKEYLDCKIPDEITAKANRLAQISKSWFSIPTHKNIIINALQEKPQNLSQWSLRGHKLNNATILFYTYYRTN